MWHVSPLISGATTQARRPGGNRKLPSDHTICNFIVRTTAPARMGLRGVVCRGRPMSLPTLHSLAGPCGRAASRCSSRSSHPPVPFGPPRRPSTTISVSGTITQTICPYSSRSKPYATSKLFPCPSTRSRQRPTASETSTVSKVTATMI